MEGKSWEEMSRSQRKDAKRWDGMSWCWESKQKVTRDKEWVKKGAIEEGDKDRREGEKDTE